MNVKRFLESHKETDDRINVGLEEIAQLRALAERTTRYISFDGGSRPKGAVSDKVGNYAVKIADLEAKIDREIDRLVDIREQIEEMASSLGDETQRNVIMRHYILHEPWELVAEKLCFSPRHVMRLHRQALEKLTEMCGERPAAKCVATFFNGRVHHLG